MSHSKTLLSKIEDEIGDVQDQLALVLQQFDENVNQKLQLAYDKLESVSFNLWRLHQTDEIDELVERGEELEFDEWSCD